MREAASLRETRRLGGGGGVLGRHVGGEVMTNISWSTQEEQDEAKVESQKVETLNCIVNRCSYHCGLSCEVLPPLASWCSYSQAFIVKGLSFWQKSGVFREEITVAWSNKTLCSLSQFNKINMFQLQGCPSAKTAQSYFSVCPQISIRAFCGCTKPQELLPSSSPFKCILGPNEVWLCLLSHVLTEQADLSACRTWQRRVWVRLRGMQHSHSFSWKPCKGSHGAMDGQLTEAPLLLGKNNRIFFLIFTAVQKSHKLFLKCA